MMNDYEESLKKEAKWAEIDMDALAYNMKNIRSKVGSGHRIAAVVKANAYGHGILPLIDTLKESGADQFAVATLNEALESRKALPDDDILVLGVLPIGTEQVSVSAGIQHTVSSYEKAKALSEAAEKLNMTAKVHIKLDTGMTRIGFQMTEEAVDEVLKIKELPCLDIEGIFTHLARADETDRKWAEKQYERYKWFVGELEKKGMTFRLKHVSNSAAIMEMPETYCDMVRPGIILYGIYPSGEMNPESLDIKPVMSFKARITHVKELPEDRQVSYGGKYTASEGDRIGTIAVGYADGYTRAQSGKAEVLYRGRRVKVIGNICMDQCMIDLSEFPDAAAGDEVVLIGRSGDEIITADEVASRYGTIGYEVVCAVNRRVPRYYMKNGKPVDKADYLF
jgi:alanine racemase